MVKGWQGRTASTKELINAYKVIGWRITRKKITWETYEKMGDNIKMYLGERGCNGLD
jgi:hypothetical protein